MPLPYKYCITFVDIIPFRFGCIFIYFPRPFPLLRRFMFIFNGAAELFFSFSFFSCPELNFFYILASGMASLFMLFSHKNAIKRETRALHVATLSVGGARMIPNYEICVCFPAWQLALAVGLGSVRSFTRLRPTF
jgi:hypothetical protein